MNILAVNPWIHDFAAFDFWLKPYGFLCLLTALAKTGHTIQYIDCTDHKRKTDLYGRGKFFCRKIKKPEILSSVPRIFRQYGISEKEFRARLQDIDPDLILITSSMTYWYTGLKATEQILNEKFPYLPLLLGGTYATLMPKHAKKTFPGAEILTGSAFREIFAATGSRLSREKIYNTLPAYDKFYTGLDYAVIRSSWGCPFSCTYCAIKQISPVFFRLDPGLVTAYISAYADKGLKHFVFYDDALLYPRAEAALLFKKIKKLKLSLNFHTPNAMHLRYLDREMAELLKDCGFINPHFGLETMDKDLQKQWGGKVCSENLNTAVKNLRNAGYSKGEFSVYMLLGFPGQDLDRLKTEIDQIHSLGAKISLAEFSPVPGTAIYKKYADLLSDPLQHNNSIFSFFPDKIKDFYQLKDYVRQLNKSFG